MKLTEIRECYYSHSGKASDVARQLAFAGIAIIWIFKDGAPASPKVPEPLLLPLIGFAITLALDLLQYVFASLLWGAYGQIKERWGDAHGADKGEEYKPHEWINVPALACFWLKIAAVVVAYGVLVLFLIQTWGIARSQ